MGFPQGFMEFLSISHRLPSSSTSSKMHSCRYCFSGSGSSALQLASLQSEEFMVHGLGACSFRKASVRSVCCAGPLH